MIEGTRFRLVGLIEWLVAAGCVLAVLVAGAVLTGEFEHVRPIIPVLAGAATAPVAPANLRPGSILVPELVLPDGKRLQVHAAASTLAMLGPQAQSSTASWDRLDDTTREARTYRYAGLEFVVVTAHDEIVAIYR